MGSLNSSAGKRPNTRFQTLSQSTAAISPESVQGHAFENTVGVMTHVHIQCSVCVHTVVQVELRYGQQDSGKRQV